MIKSTAGRVPVDAEVEEEEEDEDDDDEEADVDEDVVEAAADDPLLPPPLRPDDAPSKSADSDMMDMTVSPMASAL